MDGQGSFHVSFPWHLPHQAKTNAKLHARQPVFQAAQRQAGGRRLLRQKLLSSCQAPSRVPRDAQMSLCLDLVLQNLQRSGAWLPFVVPTSRSFEEKKRKAVCPWDSGGFLEKNRIPGKDGNGRMLGAALPTTISRVHRPSQERLSNQTGKSIGANMYRVAQKTKKCG